MPPVFPIDCACDQSCPCREDELSRRIRALEAERLRPTPRLGERIR